MSNLQMWSLIVGFFMPVLIAVLEQSKWSQVVRAVVAFVACGIAALVTVVIVSDLGTKIWIGSALTVLVTAIATYQLWWKPTGIAPTIEKATNLIT